MKYSNHLNYGHLKSIQPWWLGVERLLHKKHVSVVVDKSPLGAWYRFVCPVSNGLITWLGGPFENHKFLTTKQTFSDAFQTTIWQPLTFGPFTYQTCPVFRWLLSYTQDCLECTFVFTRIERGMMTIRDLFLKWILQLYNVAMYKLVWKHHF